MTGPCVCQLACDDGDGWGSCSKGRTTSASGSNSRRCCHCISGDWGKECCARKLLCSPCCVRERNGRQEAGRQHAQSDANRAHHSLQKEGAQTKQCCRTRLESPAATYTMLKRNATHGNMHSTTHCAEMKCAANPAPQTCHARCALHSVTEHIAEIRVWDHVARNASVPTPCRATQAPMKRETTARAK